MTYSLHRTLSVRNFQDNLRYPHEQRSLGMALVALVIGVVILGMFSFGTALILVFFALWAVSFLVRINHKRQIGNSLRINQQNFPEVADQVILAVQALRPPPVQVFVWQDNQVSAYAFGWSSPQAIVLSSELIEEMDADELRFVVGHEMGHVALGHTRIQTLIGGIFSAPVVALVSNLLSPIFNSWSRVAELSADRAGLIACGDLDKAVSALLKLLVGSKLAARVSVESVIQQSQELTGWLSQSSAAHPHTVDRIRKLVEFWDTDECQQLRDQAAEFQTAPAY